MYFKFLIPSFVCILILASCERCCVPPFCDSDEPVYSEGDTIWIHDVQKDSLYIANTLALGDDGSIYYSAQGSTATWKAARIVALNRKDGTVKWESETLDDIGINGQIVVGDDGTVYAIGNKTLFGFDPDDGSTRLKWEVPSTLSYKGNEVFVGGGVGALSLTNEGNLIFSSVESGVYYRTLFCLNPKTEQLVWYNIDATDWGVASGIFIGPDNTAFYYSRLTFDGVGKNYLVALNGSNGNIIWTKEIFTHGNSANNIVVKDDGNLFCTFSLPGDVTRYYVINSSDGSILWSSSQEAYGYEKWISPDGGLFEEFWGIHSVDPSTGERKEIVSCEFGSITENNTLVCAFTDFDHIRKLGVFYADGLQDFSVYMEGLEGHHFVIDEDSRIYGIINLHPASRLPTKICAIQGNSPLAKSGWPRPFHDNRNTSNWSKN